MNQHQKYEEWLNRLRDLRSELALQAAKQALARQENEKYEEWVNRTGAAHSLETPTVKDTLDTLGKHLHHVERVIQLGANNGILLTGADLVKLVLEFSYES